jgi:dolichol-phosphate mannosyltransferase
VSCAPTVELAIIIPTFNERANIASVLECLKKALQGINYEVIFVDDDSPDNTAGLVRAIASLDPRVRVIHRVNRRGLASACMEGMLSTAAPYLAVMDADLQHDERILPEMLQTLKAENLDVVVGSRNVDGGSMGEFANWRVALSMFGRRLSSMVCRCEIADPMSGFFVLRREFFMEAAHRVSGVGFKILVDLLASAGRRPKVREIPYTFRERLHGESKLDILVAIEYFQLLWDKTIGDLIPSAFIMFALVGSVGIAVYFAIFTSALFFIRSSFNVAQVAAAGCAMTANFFLNNTITFRGARLKGRRIIVGLATFYAACSIGLWINLKMANAAGAAGAKWYTAGLLGLGVGSIWNYGVTQMFTWRAGRKHLNKSGPVPLASEIPMPGGEFGPGIIEVKSIVPSAAETVADRLLSAK